jgi:hypothetical protein
MEREALPRDKELIAKILSFLAEDDGRLEHFFATTGFDMAGIRDAVRAPLFAEALIDYVLEDDARVVAFGAFLNVPPEVVASLQGSSRDSAKAQERSDRLPIPPRRISGI